MKTNGKVMLATALLFLIPAFVEAQPYPKAVGYVNDFANILSAQQTTSLNDELVEFQKKTSIEMAVVTVSTLGNQSVEEYTRGLANEWGVGKPTKNNGVVFLIAPKERKMRIEIASGVLSTFPASRANTIRDTVILPYFKKGQMAEGVMEGARAIILNIDSAPSATPPVLEAVVPPQKAGEREPSRPVALPAQEKTNDAATTVITVLGFIFGVALFVILVFLALAPTISRVNDRAYVLREREAVAKKLEEAEELAKHADVKDTSRFQLRHLQEKFTPIRSLTAESRDVSWGGAHGTVDGVNVALGTLIHEMKRSIVFADRARVEGPKLFEQMKGKLEGSKVVLAQGKPSSRAGDHLQKAQARYDQVQFQQEDTESVNWLVLYPLLLEADSSIDQARTAHAQANREVPSSSYHRSSSSSDSTTPSPSVSIPDPTPSSGPDISGFSGGNFTGGDGSTGGW